MRLFGLSLFPVIFLTAATAAWAEDPLSLENLRDLERVVAGHSPSFAACSKYPCPDVDCAGFQAARDALSNASALIGTPQRTGIETTWGDFERREKTLGYWMEQEWNAKRKHYDDLLGQANTNMTKAARTEWWAEWQRAFINASKLAQLYLELRNLGAFFREQACGPTSPSLLPDILAVNEILGAGSNMLEGATLVDQALKEQKLLSGNAGIPNSVDAPNSLANAVQTAFAGVGNLEEARRIGAMAQAQKKQLLELAIKPLDLSNVSSTTARHNRKLERDALRLAYEGNVRKAWEVARKAKVAGATAALKIATMYAEQQQAELRERIAEMKANLSAEEKAMADQVEGMVEADQRRLALLALKARIDEALSQLSSCEKSCTAPPPPAPPEVPVKSFSVPSTDAAGNPVPRESYGAAMAWFRQSFGNAAAAMKQAGAFRIEDSRMSLIPQPQRVALKAPIVIKAEGSICLMKRGEIFRDGEKRNTSLDNPLVTFNGKDKPGDYTYEYALRDPFDDDDGKYKASTIVTVGKNSLTGYWLRTSSVTIINGLGEQIDWSAAAPKGIVISEPEGGGAAMAYLPAKQGLAKSFTSNFSPKCSLAESTLSCRFENDIDCGGQWYTLEVKAESETTARLKVLDGELTHRTDQGCQRFKHFYTPFDFTLERETADGPLEKANPCPPGFRCQ
jgi:hypothetical protein